MNGDQREQAERDIENLRRRLQELPAESPWRSGSRPLIGPPADRSSARQGHPWNRTEPFTATLP